jgi:hypothetical protein
MERDTPTDTMERDNPTDVARQALDKALREPYQSETRDGHRIVGWVITIFMLLKALLEALIVEIYGRIEDCEERDTPAHVPIPTQPPSASAATPQARRSAPASRRRTRCATCHATGHDTADCRTANPAVMRKRVALNQRAKRSAKDVRTLNSSLVPPPLLPAVVPHASAAYYPPDFAGLASDAAELRRRRNQSSRDKKRIRRSAT